MFVTGIIAFRIMGSQAVGQLTDFDLVVVIAIGALMGAPLIDQNINPLLAITAISGFVIAQILFSFLSLKSRKMEDLIKGNPIPLINNGKMIKNGLLKARMTKRNLEQELRIRGFSSITEVEQANLEPNGKISFIFKKNK